MVDIIGVPFDYGGKRLGSRLGPTAIRLAELVSALRLLGLDIADRGDLSIEDLPDTDEGFRGFPAFLECVRALRAAVDQSLNAKHVPIVLGGEHTLVVGSISSALNANGDGLGVLWIDAHADANTPATSASGNLHGMPLAALMGLPDGVEGTHRDQWKELLAALGPKRLNPSQVAWYALRQVDPGELSRVDDGFAVTMHEIDRFGIEETVDRLDRFWRASGTTELWVSFDVDALDPILAPGTGTAVRGGLSYRESHLFAELLRERLDEPACPYRLCGIDLVETNPLFDNCNETAKMAVEWIASLLGKTILGR
jgi:arginase